MKDNEVDTCGSNVNVIGADLRGGRCVVDSASLEQLLVARHFK
jgi:hypothetical protein